MAGHAHSARMHTSSCGYGGVFSQSASVAVHDGALVAALHARLALGHQPTKGRREARVVLLAQSLPPRQRPPCDGCGDAPFIVVEGHGLCRRCATRVMYADGVACDSDSDD